MYDTLNRRVLVLNQSYQPLMVIGAKRAIILLLSDKSECIENYSDVKINDIIETFEVIETARTL